MVLRKQQSGPTCLKFSKGWQPSEQGCSCIPYGRPFKNQTMYILDDATMEHCEKWVTGVIYIGGAGVALGYHNNPEKTKKQFIIHPKTKEYLFRTGDLGRLRSNGELEILGREDSQVKVNGYRIELGEIEKMGDLADARAISVICAVKKKLIVMYVVYDRNKQNTNNTNKDIDQNDASNNSASNDLNATADPFLDFFVPTVIEICRAQLPAYMIPQAFVEIKSMPLSSNGKVDRKALRPPTVQERSMHRSSSSKGAGENKEGENEQPMADHEITVAKLFAQVLGLETDTMLMHHNFFELGGDSLAALRLLSGIQKAFNVSLGVNALFDASTVGSFANVVFRKLQKRNAMNSSSNGITNLLNERKLENDKGNDVEEQLSLVTLKKGKIENLTGGLQSNGNGGNESSTAPPLLLIHAAGSSILHYRSLVNVLVPDYERDVLGIEDTSLSGSTVFEFESIGEVADSVIRQLEKKYEALNGMPSTMFVGGWSYGGVVALEVTHRLESMGVVVPATFLLDAPVRVEGESGGGGKNDGGEKDEVDKLPGKIDLRFFFSFSCF